MEAIAIRLEAIVIRLEAIAIRMPYLEVWKTEKGCMIMEKGGRICMHIVQEDKLFWKEEG